MDFKWKLSIGICTACQPSSVTLMRQVNDHLEMNECLQALLAALPSCGQYYVRKWKYR